MAKKKDGGLTVHEPDPKALSDSEALAGGSAKPKRSKVAYLALLIAILALFFALSGRMSSDRAAISSMNQMVTDSVVPEMRRSRRIDLVNMVYDLKGVSVTLEKIKETSNNEEIRAMVDKLRKDIEDLSVKIYVYE